MTDTTWERWARLSGIGFAVLFVVGFILYGDAPGPKAAGSELTSFYDGDRGRILTSVMIMGIAQILLFLFIGAIASAVREAGKGGWAAASIASGATVIAFFWVLVGINAALAFQIAGQSEEGIVMALSDLQWTLIVMLAFPGAALVGIASIGLWRAGLVPDWFGWAGIGGAIAFLLAGTTWADSGFWAPDGAYSAWIAPIIFVLWTLGASWLLYRMSPVVERAPETASARPA